MRKIKEMPKIEDNEVYQWLDKKLGQFRMGWISGFAAALCIWLIFSTNGLIFGFAIATLILNVPRLFKGK